ncbi:MAG: hypothetical protein ACYDHZ_05995 [Dehalococcoidia bacterium]
MAKTPKILPIIFIIMVILAGLGLSGCSAGTGAQSSTPAVQQPSSSSAPSSSGNGQGDASSGQRGSRGPGGPNMSAILNKAADILGISESTFTSAFNDARTSVFGSRPSGGRTGGGQSPSGGPGGPPPSENRTWGGQPPSGSGGGQPSAMMTQVYAQMATALNISADKISAAMQQAFTESRGQTGTVQ